MYDLALGRFPDVEPLFLPELGPAVGADVV